VAANYYGRLRELTLRGGLRGTHPESGGPFFEHWIDALQCEGVNDVPMGEFWKRNSEPDGPIIWPDNPTLKQAACAAHIYGKPICQAEAFTSFGDDWMDDPWSMKDIGDAAFCAGLTRNVLCFWIHQSLLDAKPGFQWSHVGTHFDWIHRHDGGTDIYFVSNQGSNNSTVRVVFRVAGKTPELWDAVSGEIRDLPEHRATEDGRTEVPMRFAPRQSFFVVFKSKAPKENDADGKKNFPEVVPVRAIAGPWTVRFDPKWFYPDNGSGGKVRFDQLEDWTRRPRKASATTQGSRPIGLCLISNRTRRPASCCSIWVR
jgi:hypothetical protein